MSRYIGNLQDAVIASGTTTSNWVGGFEDSETITIWAPTALTNAVHIEVHPDDTDTDSSSWDFLSAGSTVAVPAGGMVTIVESGFRRIRFVSAANEGANRTFKLRKQWVG